MAQPTRIGIIGLGDIGIMHLRGFELQAADRCEIGALCELDPGRIALARNRLTRSQPEVFNDYRRMLDEAHIHAVVVGVPSYLHRETAVAALEAGMDVFLEKPVAHAMEDCDAIIRAWHETDRVLQIGLVYRYSNLYRTLARMVEAGDLGRVTAAYCKEYRESFPMDWFFHRDKSGGAILDKNCHHFDLFSWFIGAPAVRVQAMGGQHVLKGENCGIRCSYSREPGQVVRNPDIVDHAFVNVEYANGARASLGLCMYQLPPVEGLQIGLMGDNGAHAAATRDVELMAGGGPLGPVREIPVDYEGDNRGVGHIGCLVEQAEFLDCVRDRTVPWAHVFTGRDSMAVCLAAQRAIDQGRDVFISEFESEEMERIRAERIAARDRSPAPMSAQVRSETAASILLGALFDLGRFFFAGRDRPEPPARGRGFDPLRVIRTLAGARKRYAAASRGLEARIGFRLPGMKPLVVAFDNGRILPSRDEPEVTVVFSEEGLKRLLRGESVQKLMLADRIGVEGDYARLTPYTDAFMILAESFKELI